MYSVSIVLKSLEDWQDNANVITFVFYHRRPSFSARSKITQRDFCATE